MRPEDGKNDFTFFMVAVLNKGPEDPKTYVDQFKAIDDAGTNGENGTHDGDGSVMSIEVSIRKAPLPSPDPKPPLRG